MKKALYITLAVIGVAIFIAIKIYNKPHRQAEKEAGIPIDAISLFEAFEKNETEANTKYLDQVLEVNGVISSVMKNQEGTQVIVLKSNDLLFGVSCTLMAREKPVNAGDTVTIKGFCKGYLSDVVLTDCVITSKEK